MLLCIERCARLCSSSLEYNQVNAETISVTVSSWLLQNWKQITRNCSQSQPTFSLYCTQTNKEIKWNCFILLLPPSSSSPNFTQEEGVRERTRTHSQRMTAGREQVRPAARGSGYGSGGLHRDGKGGGDWKKCVHLCLCWLLEQSK